ncbi:MAG: hypothetical protein ACREFW_01925 [Rhizomicrobium sp.]
MSATARARKSPTPATLESRLEQQACRELRELARAWGPKAIERLAVLAGLEGCGASESQQAQMGALKELLDRAYGRAQPPLSGDSGQPVITGIERVIVRKARDPET